ncbi:hypothetical protein [Streptomyces chartreusis]
MVQTHQDLFTALVTEVIHLPDEQRHDVRRTQHDHVMEWVRLLRARRPELPRAEAQALVHAVLAMVNTMSSARGTCGVDPGLRTSCSSCRRVLLSAR